jgi:uncharacterized protein
MSIPSSRPLALVTGASTGIGLELAKQFAANGFDLVVTAHSDALDDAVRELRALGGEVECVRADLAKPEGVDQVWGHVQTLGRHVRSTVQPAKYVVRGMTARGEGRILFTSSIASTMPGSFQAVYNASKSFVQSFALALRNELKDTNVTITALMAGKDRVVSASLSTKLQGRGSRLLPDGVKAEMHRKMAEPGSGRTS